MVSFSVAPIICWQICIIFLHIHFSIGQYGLTLGISHFLHSTGTVLASCKERTQFIRSHNICGSGSGLDKENDTFVKCVSLFFQMIEWGKEA